MKLDILDKMRHPKWIDLNPHAGDSWWGLTRQQSKTLALFFIIFGILLASPPFLPSPDDFLNIIIAKWIIDIFPSIQSGTALLFTYTLLAWGLFILGIWIFPAPTNSLFNGYMNKLKTFIRRQFKNPIALIIWIILGYILFNFYKGLL